MFLLINNAENIMTNLLSDPSQFFYLIKTCEILPDEHQQNLKSISNGATELLSLGLVAKIIIFQGWMGFQR